MLPQHHDKNPEKSYNTWIVRTPAESCVKTTDPGNLFDIFLALKMQIIREVCLSQGKRTSVMGLGDLPEH